MVSRIPTNGSVHGQRSAAPSRVAAAWAAPGAMTNVAAVKLPHRHRFIDVGGSAVASRDYQAKPRATIAATHRMVTCPGERRISMRGVPVVGGVGLDRERHLERER